MATAVKDIQPDHWHVWKDDGKTVTYIGGYYNANGMKLAMDYRNAQDKPEQFTVTNKGPMGIVKEFVDDPDGVKADPVKFRQYQEASKSWGPNGRIANVTQITAPTTSRRRQTRPTAPVTPPKPVVPIVVDKALADVAQAELAKHKADEAAELAAEAEAADA